MPDSKYIDNIIEIDSIINTILTRVLPSNDEYLNYNTQREYLIYLLNKFNIKENKARYIVKLVLLELEQHFNKLMDVNLSDTYNLEDNFIDATEDYVFEQLLLKYDISKDMHSTLVKYWLNDIYSLTYDHMSSSFKVFVAYLIYIIHDDKEYQWLIDREYLDILVILTFSDLEVKRVPIVKDSIQLDRAFKEVYLNGF